MMSKSEIENQIIEMISEISEQNLNYFDIYTPFDELEVDSLMALELSVHIEREFGVYLYEEDLVKISCINDLFLIIDERL